MAAGLRALRARSGRALVRKRAHGGLRRASRPRCVSVGRLARVFGQRRLLATRPAAAGSSPVKLNVQELPSMKDEDYDPETTPPVVVMHGLLGSISNWRTLAASAEMGHNRRVFVVDMRNHGTSPHSEEMTYLDMAADIEALLDRLEVPRAALVGHSMGGKAAITMALTRPERVASLVAVDVAPVVYDFDPTSPLSLHNILGTMAAVDLSQVRTRGDAEEQMREGIPDRTVRAFVLQNLRPVAIDRDARNANSSNNSKNSNSKGEAQSAEGAATKKERLQAKRVQGRDWGWRCNLPVLRRALPNVTGFPPLSPARTEPFSGPSLFVGGSRSDHILPEHHMVIRALFPNAEIEMMDTSHWVHSERPQEFLQLVGKWRKGVEEK